MSSWLPAPRLVRMGFAAAGGWLVLHQARVLAGSDLGPDLLFHRFAHLGVLLFAAASCLMGAWRSRDERAAWTLIGLGLLAWSAGETWYTTVLWDDPSPPLPSPADVGFQLLPPLLLVGLVMLLRRRVRDIPQALWVDGLIAGLAISALSAAVIFEQLLQHRDGDPLAVAVALSYQVGDMVLLAVIAAALAAMAWRVDRRWALLLGGVLSFWIADSLYSVTAVAGEYESGGWFDVGWWAGLLAVGAAAWQPRSAALKPEPDATLVMAVPLGFGSVGLALLVYASVASLNLMAVGLAAASLVAVMARLMITFRDHVAMLRASRADARTDALTGLGNRRALTRALQELPNAGDGQPLVLALFDLDGFKAYNDSFGHPAGDKLLKRRGAALAAYLGDRGQAFRIGGDEFCALFRPGHDVAELIICGAAAALSERGDAHQVGCSYGAVSLPRETCDAEAAMLIADQRLYACKLSCRVSASVKAREVLALT